MHAPLLFTACAFGLCVLFASCESQPEHVSKSQAVHVDTQWPAFVDEFLTAHFKANPGFAVNQGRHEFDGQLPDWSRAGIEREIARLATMRERAMGFDTATLSEA